MPDRPTTSIRLTDQDRENADKIIARGMATDLASAIRAGLAALAHGLVKPKR
jgi:hypothetical protein